MSITEAIACYLSFVAAITLVALAIMIVSNAMDKRNDSRSNFGITEIITGRADYLRVATNEHKQER